MDVIMGYWVAAIDEVRDRYRSEKVHKIGTL